MRPSPWTSIGVSDDIARAHHARVRFGVALVCSGLIHALVSTGLTGGRSIRASPSVPSTVLNADLVIPAPPLAVAPAEVAARPSPPGRAARRIAPAHPPGAESSRSPDNAGPADIPDPTYYGARQLDVYPVLAGGLDWGRVGGTRVAARVLVLVLIDAEGRVDEVSVIEAEPRGAYEESTREAFASARFKPALKDGRPVRSRLLVEVDFSDSAPR